ncbi:MAG: hypothetical protein Q7J32_05050 [Sphingomonadaceae bacterium]|nr:hypothetical protein [Sphingomonadaceae bacterium]
MTLLNIVEGTLSQPGIVVEVERGHLTARWETNDRLIVSACDAISYDVKARSFRSALFRADGSEDAVYIDVASLPNTLRNGVSSARPRAADRSASQQMKRAAPKDGPFFWSLSPLGRG